MNPTPLLIHLVFHPASDAARAMAHAFHRALNADPLLPGLRVPTVMLRERDDRRPPALPDFSESERALVVVFADDHIAADDPPAGAGSSWSSFVADLHAACDGRVRRVVPVQLSDAAWPLDERLRTISFLRAQLQPPASQQAWVDRHLVIEIIRFLRGLTADGPAPVRLFLSHAKQDLGAEPKAFAAIAGYLDNTKPVETWIDSAKIPPGSDFGEVIGRGVSASAVLVLLTVAYSGRPWCRREVLLAKKHECAIVVLDALRGVDLRSFPYLGNVPVVAWRDDEPARAVDLLLREFLRVEHVRLVLQGQADKDKDEVVMSSVPELVTLAGIARGRSVLYPDPPLSDEEAEALAPLGIALSTPLQRAGAQRTLSRRRIALSISPSEDIGRHGLQRMQLDETLLEVSRHLLARGATLVYGGHLDPKESYTRDLADLVAGYQAQGRSASVQRLVNYVGWPLPLTVEQRSPFKLMMSFERIARPDGIAELEPATFVAEPLVTFPADTAVRRYAWARGMSAMREQQSREVDARIVLGGKVGPAPTAPNANDARAWYLGRIPGVLEEVVETVLAGKPLYLCGAFGGGAALAIEMLEGGSPQAFTWDYQKRAPNAEGMRGLYATQGQSWRDYPEMRDLLVQLGVAGLARANGLSEAQNRALFVARDPARILELVLTGLANVAFPAA